MTAIASDILAQYHHAKAELDGAEKKASGKKTPTLADRNDVAMWRHIVTKLEERYGLGKDAI